MIKRKTIGRTLTKSMCDHEYIFEVQYLLEKEQKKKLKSINNIIYVCMYIYIHCMYNICLF